MPPRQKKGRFPLAVTAVVIILLIIGGLLLLVHRHNPKTATASTTPSLTLYYSDGKTVLWHRGAEDSPKTQAPYFVALVEGSLKQKYGQDYLDKGAWSVTTTLDSDLQPTAEKLVADNATTMQTTTGGVADEAALVLQDVKTGQIKALVGGVNSGDTEEGHVNYANTILPGGTSMLPFDYAALIDETTTAGAGSPIDDTQGPLPGYACTNTSLPSPPSGEGNCAFDADFKYPGTLSVRYALGGNRKVPAIKAMLGAVPGDTNRLQIASIDKTIQLVDDMSADKAYKCYSDAALTKTTQCYTASAIGDSAYITLLNELHGLATIANNGKKMPQTTIISVRLNGKKQAIPGQSGSRQVIKPDTAYILNNILSDPNASYLPGSCDTSVCASFASGGYKFQRYQGWDFAVDPGATTDGYGATMASWSTQYAAISWVGNSSQNKALPVVGELLTEPLTRGMMEAAHAGKSPANWQQPGDIQTLPAFVVSNRIHYGDVEPSPAMDIYPAWYKQH